MRYIVFTFLIAFVILTGCTQQSSDTGLNDTNERFVREINVTAERFSFTPDPIMVNVGDKVRLNIMSLDVTHGFAIDEFEINEVIPAGQTVSIEFIADKSGVFSTRCTVPCGTGHPMMIGTLIVEEIETAETPTQSEGEIVMEGLLDGAAGILGSPNATIVMIEYSDFQCPYCRSWYMNTRGQLQSEYIDKGDVLFVYKDFPLSSMHPMAQTYAEAARCAGDQGNFWEYHDKIFDEQNKFGTGTVSHLTVEDVKRWAQELELNTEEFNSCLSNGTHAQEVQANIDEARKLGIKGTPSFVIGKINGTGQLVAGAYPYSTFKSIIDSLNG
jgi:protein-disulfide isomerase